MQLVLEGHAILMPSCGFQQCIIGSQYCLRVGAKHGPILPKTRRTDLLVLTVPELSFQLMPICGFRPQHERASRLLTRRSEA